MKRSILVLISAFAIFLVTLLVTNDYMTTENIHEADRINDMQVQSISRRMDANMSLQEQSAHSFLSGIFYYDIDKFENGQDTLIYIREGEIHNFHHYVYDSLRDFVKTNPSILSAAFLIDASVYPTEGTDGFGPAIDQGDSVGYDLSKRYDFQKSESYQTMKTTGNCIWRIPTMTSKMHDRSIIYYIPIRRETGEFFGAFAINVNVNVLRDGLTKMLPYGKDDSFILTVDDDENILFSTNKFQESFKNISDYRAFLKTDNDYDWQAGDSIHHERATWCGDEYFVYRSQLTNAPWQTVTICRKAAIYSELTRTLRVILIVSAIGMLLMLVCCAVIFRLVKRHIAQRVAAEGEIKMAADVQQSLLKPTDYHTADITLNAFMRPAREAGGDLYDYVEKDGRLLFCIGDVSGKGMPAALFMTQVVSLFRNSTMFTDSPELIASQMNNVLALNNPSMTFCTLFIGVLDTATHQLTFCNAGHNRPVICPAQKTAAAPYFLNVNPNIALGLMENFPYQPETITLHAGDTLLLYTDGVTEAKAASGEFFGDDRLLNTATTPTVTAVTSAVDGFVNGYEQSDDITVLSIER